MKPSNPVERKQLKVTREAHKRADMFATENETTIVDVVSGLIMKHLPPVRKRRSRAKSDFIHT